MVAEQDGTFVSDAGGTESCAKTGTYSDSAAAAGRIARLVVEIVMAISLTAWKQGRSWGLEFGPKRQ
jgi:hypothetical protein